MIPKSYFLSSYQHFLKKPEPFIDKKGSFGFRYLLESLFIERQTVTEFHHCAWWQNLRKEYFRCIRNEKNETRDKNVCNNTEKPTSRSLPFARNSTHWNVMNQKLGGILWVSYLFSQLPRYDCPTAISALITYPSAATHTTARWDDTDTATSAVIFRICTTWYHFDVSAPNMKMLKMRKSSDPQN